MVRIGISVEGLTEERFVKVVLAPYLLDKGILMTPINKKGNISVDSVKAELKTLVKTFEFVTTLYDFYGFKKKNQNETKESLERRIEEAMHDDVRRKLIPYVQMYEFEALLFSCPDSMARELNDGSVKEWCEGVLSKFGAQPELINNSPQTAPSKRLEAHTDYRKTTHGPNIAKGIGIEKIREKCPGFNRWLTKLEELAL